MTDYENPIPESSRGRLHAAVLERDGPSRSGLAFKGIVAAVASALFGLVLIGYLVQPSSTISLGLVAFTILTFLPLAGVVAYRLLRPRPTPVYELRQDGVLVKPHVFIRWEEIASVNFEGRFASDRSTYPISKPFIVRQRTLHLDDDDDMALGFVLRDFDAVIQRGPHEETIDLVDPYGDTPGQAVVDFTFRLDRDTYIRLLQITDAVLAAHGIPFRQESSGTRRLERQEYRASRDTPEG